MNHPVLIVEDAPSRSIVEAVAACAASVQVVERRSWMASMEPGWILRLLTHGYWWCPICERPSEPNTADPGDVNRGCNLCGSGRLTWMPPAL